MASSREIAPLEAAQAGAVSTADLPITIAGADSTTPSRTSTDSNVAGGEPGSRSTGQHALHLEQPMSPANLGGSGGRGDGIASGGSMRMIAMPSHIEEEDLSRLMSTRNTGRGGGIPVLPVAAWSQQAAVQLIEEPTAPAPEAVELPVEGGPEAVPPTSPPSGTAAAAAAGGAGVTTLPPTTATVVGTTPAPAYAGGEPEEGVWLGACKPVRRCCGWYRRDKKGEPKGAKGAVMAKEYSADEHKISLQELAERFGTDIDVANPAKSKGLTAEEARKRLHDQGPNQLSPPKELPAILQFAKQFGNLLMVMLLIASGLAFISWGITGDWTVLVLAVVLLVVVFFTCALNYFQERSASNVLASIRSMLPSACVVVRDGAETKVPATQLVVGDVVHLTIGNRIPADIRIIHCNDLKVENSSLTGESEPVECTVEKQSDMVTEAKNFIFNSSLVMNGEARGVVVRTGDRSFIGCIAGLAGQTRQSKSSLEIEVEHVVRIIAVIGLITGIIACIIGLANGRGVVFALTTGLLLTIVANVPEGLPTTVVTVLSLTAQRMGEQHVLIKRTQLIENIGATTVIASDKTGTLTQNKMTVENVWCNRSFSSAHKVRHAGAGAPAGAGGIGAAAAGVGLPTPLAGAGGLAPGAEAGAAITIGRGTSFAAGGFPMRRGDPISSMTVGRQMSVLHDGTMVIHSSTTTYGRGAGGMGLGGGSSFAMRPGASFAATGHGLAPSPVGHVGAPPVIASPAGGLPPAAAPAGGAGTRGGGYKAIPDFGAAGKTAPVAGAATTAGVGSPAVEAAAVSSYTGTTAGAVEEGTGAPGTIAAPGEGSVEGLGGPAGPAAPQEKLRASDVSGPGALQPLPSTVRLPPSATQPRGETAQAAGGPAAPISPGQVSMMSSPSVDRLPPLPVTTTGTTSSLAELRSQQVVPHETERPPSGDLASAGLGTMSDPAMRPHAGAPAVEGGIGIGAINEPVPLGAATPGTASSNGIHPPEVSGAEGVQGPVSMERILQQGVPPPAGAAHGRDPTQGGPGFSPRTPPPTLTPSGHHMVPQSPSLLQASAGMGVTRAPAAAGVPPAGTGSGKGAPTTSTALVESKHAPGGAGGAGGGKGGGGGGSDEPPKRSDSIQQQGSYRSFNSFQGMTQASWQRSNAFTRLVTIAAICNRAQFTEDSDADKPKLLGKEVAPEEETQGVFTSQLKKRQEAEAARKAAMGGPSGGHSTEPGRFTGTILGPAGQGALPKRKVLGDASEAALLTYVDSLIPIFEFTMAYPKVFEVPFNSVNKWALAITKDPEDAGSHIVMMKGAPERILDRCSQFLYNGTERPIDEDFKLDFQASYERFAFSGERVLAFAYREFKPPRGAQSDPATVYKQTVGKDEKGEPIEPYPTKDLVFAGLISLMDPPKEGTSDAVAICRDAYVKVVMVTGDHPLTAEAIARRVNIVTLPTAREIAAEDGVEEADIPLGDPRVQAAIVPGYAIPSLTQEQWDILLSKEEVVFARTSPQQKLQIVDNFQRLGHVVTVTGDGTNDSPALKKAQVGVSMGGATASDVAREVLLDDNFASIVLAIEMGRLAYANIKKTIAYTLSHATPEVVPIFLDLAFGIPLALPGLLVLVVDLITEQGPAISLSYEPPESTLMRQPPRNLKTDRMVDWRLLRYSYLISGVVTTGVCLLAYFIVLFTFGITGSSIWQASKNGFFAFDGNSPPFTADNGTVYSGQEQRAIIFQAHAAYFFNLVACQCINVFLCKTRFVSLFKHGPLRNHTTAYGVSIAIFVALAIIYIGAWQTVFQTSYLMGYLFLTPLIYLAIMLPYTEYSKKVTRRNPTGWWARKMQW